MSSAEFNTEMETLRAKLAEAESKLAEAQEVIRAIQAGDVDAVVVAGPEGEQVFTLQGAEYAYRALVEAMNEGAATLGADGTVLYCNQRLSDLLGIPQEQIIGNHVKRNVAVGAIFDFDVLLAKAWSGEPCKTELEFQTRQGDIIPVHVSLRKMALEAAELCMVVTDLTERKKTDELKRIQEVLLAREAQLATLANLVPQFVWMCTPDGSNIYFNERLVDYTGMTLEESYGKGWNSPFHPDDKQAASDAWNRATEIGEQYRIESRLRAADGASRWFLMRGEPLRNAAGAAERWFGTCTDIEASSRLKRCCVRVEPDTDHCLELVGRDVPDQPRRQNSRRESCRLRPV